jgi:gliding motility-associated-like protein
LILNPSFEDNSGCPQYNYLSEKYNYLLKLNHWQSASTRHTQHAPFYLNYDESCQLNKSHYQFQNTPRTGTSCITSMCFFEGSGEFRDYNESLEVYYQLRELLRGELSKPLVKGRKYYLSFYTVLDEGSTLSRGSKDYGINSIGCYLHANEFYFSSYFRATPEIPDSMLTPTCHQFTPQVRCSPKRFITDTVNYNEIAGVFTADGGERYITVGNFTPNALTAYKEIPKSGYRGGPHANYVFDDFTLIPYPDLGADTCIADNDSIVLEVPDYINLPADRFTWSTKQKGKSITIHKNGWYWVEYTAGYATVRDSIRITKKVGTSNLKLFKPNLSACSDSVELSLDSTRFSHFKWSTGHTSSSIFVKKKGTYTVSFQSKNGCLHKASTKVKFPKPWVEVIDSQYCFRQKQQALKIKDGAFDYIIWQGVKDDYYFGIGDSVTLWPGTKWDSIRAHAYLDGCVFTDTLFLRIYPRGIVDLPFDEMVCEPNYRRFINQAEGSSHAGANTKILWSTGSIDSFININKADTYWVRTETANGCVYTDTAYYGYDPFTIDDYLICRGDTVTVDISNLPFGKGYEFPATDWYYEDERLREYDIFKRVQFTKEGEYRMRSVIRNKEHVPRYSCFITDTFTITFDTIKKVLPNDTTICNRDEYVIWPHEPFDSMVWSMANNTNNYLRIKKPYGDYSVIAYRNGCSAKDSISINFDSLYYKITGANTICKGDSAVIKIKTKNNFIWENGSSDSIYHAKAGINQVYIYNEACGVNAQKIISNYVLDTLVNPFAQDTMCLIDSPGIKNPNPQAWFILNGDSISTQQLALNKAGFYQIEYKNQCFSFSKEVLVRDDCLVLSIPTAFSPNGDGVNDTFKIGGLDYREFTCTVYNRNGQKLNTATNPMSIWSGYLKNGEIAPMGSYYFVAKAIDHSGEEKLINGVFTLIR